MEVSVTGISEVQIFLKMAKKGTNKIQREIYNEASLYAQEHMIKTVPMGVTSHLAQSINRFFKNFGVIIGPTVEYAVYVNDGTEPRTKLPPIAALTDWVRLKLKIKDNKKAKSVAFAIAKTIAKNGTEGTHYIQETHAKTEMFMHAMAVRWQNKIASKAFKKR